jgi:hypothetical protein
MISLRGTDAQRKPLFTTEAQRHRENLFVVFVGAASAANIG